MPTWSESKKKQTLTPAESAAVSRARRTRQSVGLACAVCVFATTTTLTATAVVGAQSAGDPPLNASSAPAAATTAPSPAPAEVSLAPSPSPSSSPSSTEPTEPTTPMADGTESPATQTPEPTTASPAPVTTITPVKTTVPPPPTPAPASSSLLPSPAPALTPTSAPSATSKTEKPPTTAPAQSPAASAPSPAPSSTQSFTVQPSITATPSTESTKSDTPAPTLVQEETTTQPPTLNSESPTPAVPEQSPAPSQSQTQQTSGLVASEQDKEIVTTTYNSTTLPPGIDANVLDGGELVNVETTAKTQNGQTSVSYTIIVKKDGVIESVQQPGFNTSDPSSTMLPSASDIVSNSTDIGSSQLGSKSSSSLSSSIIIALVIGALVVGLLVSGLFMKRRNNNKNKKANGLADARTPGSNKSTARTIEEGYSSLESFHNMDYRGTMNRTRQSSYESDYSTRPSPRHRSNGSLWEDSVIVAARIPFDKVQVGKLLSRGGFGEVYQGTYREQNVAIKKLLPETRKDLQHIENFLSEIKLQASLDHPHIVAFLGVAWESLSELYAISEFMERGDLRSLLVTYNQPGSGVPQGFSLEKVKTALHIAHALTYLHSLQPQILHRDLKSRNILLTSKLDAKLTDFGSARVRSDSDLMMTAGVGSSLWMAPEVMIGKHYDEKSDVFSLGIVLSELDTHELPYSHTKESSSSGGDSGSSSGRSGGGGRSLPDTAILQLVSVGRLQVQFSRNCPPEMVSLAQRCIHVDPKERPTAAEVLYQLHVVLRMFEKQ